MVRDQCRPRHMASGSDLPVKPPWDGDTPRRSHALLAATGRCLAMAETTGSPKQWHKPRLVAIGAREGHQPPATIDLAEGQVVVDLSDQAAPKVPRSQ